MTRHHLIVGLAACLLLAASPAADGQGTETGPPRLTFADLNRYVPGFQPSPGDWLSFDMEPATIRPFYGGPVRLRNLTLFGDVEEIEWQTAPGTAVSRHQRVAVDFSGGHRLSIFELRFPAADLRALPPLPIRYDKFHGTAAWPLRVKPTTMPVTEVVRINDQVQYSSHVVNIVAPYETAYPFLPDGDRFFNHVEVARIFYTHFTETYEELALTPTRLHRRPVGGHNDVYTNVDGINESVLDNRATFGDPRALRGINLHVRGDMMWNSHWLHETGHQWGFGFDLFDVVGVAPQGTGNCLSRDHMPLVAPLPAFMVDSCRLSARNGRRLCIREGGQGWELAACEAPTTYHPFQLYAMGLLPKEEVPPLYLRLRQDLPDSLEPGAPVEGPFVEVTIDDVVARYGERRGPAAPALWRRAHVVVSPERLLSPGDLSWYNFHAKRTSDPNVTGIEGLDRSPSLEVATRGLMDLRTAIRPREHPAVVGAFPVAFPKIGRRDIYGLVFDKVLATRYRAGRVYEISGIVRWPRGHEVVRLKICSRVVTGEIRPGKRFSVRFKLGPRDRGPRWMVFGLGESGPELGRIAPVYVE